MTKPTKMKDELAGLVARAVADAIGASGVVPPFVEGHIRDGMGGNWDVSLPAPTPAHRKAIDGIRDLYDPRAMRWRGASRKAARAKLGA